MSLSRLRCRTKKERRTGIDSWELRKWKADGKRLSSVSASSSEPFILLNISLSRPLPIEDVPKSPAKPQVTRSRDLPRIKEFPAGNMATSTSRIAFLKSLCQVPKYRLLDFVPSLVCFFFPSFQCYFNSIFEILAKSYPNTTELPFLGFLEEQRGIFTTIFPLARIFRQCSIHGQKFFWGFVSFRDQEDRSDVAPLGACISGSQPLYGNWADRKSVV